MLVKAGVNPALASLILENLIMSKKESNPPPAPPRKVENVRKELGYCGLFASRETGEEAQEYVVDIAKTTENPTAVFTAAMVLLNTLIECVERDYVLLKKEETTDEQ